MLSTAATATPPVAVSEVLPRPTNVDNHFSKNPCVTTTALAHSLWSYVLRPGIDSAIDATAGNGHDTVVMAKMLFGHTEVAENNGSEIVAIDLQPLAIERTKQALEKVIASEIIDHNIHFHVGSHAPLPLPSDSGSVALVAYNLGYLPSTGTRDGDAIMTNTSETLASLADAASIVRVGGLISVMTYPRSNPEEATAVRSFLQGLGSFSSSSKAPVDLCVDHDRIQNALDEVLVARPSSKWRGNEHQKLGWKDSPILYTVARLD